MKCLLGDRWTGGLLDPYRSDAEVRIRVLAWLQLAALDDVYFRRPHSPWLVWNYMREIGIRATLAKIASRHEERFRNQTFLAAGIGLVLESPGEPEAGSLVEFVAPRHPAAAERVVLSPRLLQPAAPDLADRLRSDAVLLLKRSAATSVAPGLMSLAGWVAESGAGLAPELMAECLRQARGELRAASWPTARRLAVSSPEPLIERHRPAAATKTCAKSAVLFGYGNYAKTAILPNLPKGLRVVAIHEIDPLQMPRNFSRSNRAGCQTVWDTSPSLRPGERYDAAFIAGFHHSHAPLAVDVLRQGGIAVVEKPIATSEHQLVSLLEALPTSDGGVFACFHKRYSRFTSLAKTDLGVPVGAPISYHCIVYEVPLPSRHWYRWPNSRTSIVSNGCHWLDHFLFLNDFAPVDRVSIAAGPEEGVSCSVVLENGAFFSMTLTHQGSERLGVRDHIELRAAGITVSLENESSYRAESRQRVIRTARQNRLLPYRVMYDTIGRRILAGEAGDTPESLEASCGLALLLDEMLLEARRVGGAVSGKPRRPKPRVLGGVAGGHGARLAMMPQR